MSQSPHVVDVDITNFEQVVLHASMQAPVLVDFWATWCEPCKTLGPVLERIADEMAGAFTLAKVDTDACAEVAQAFRIQSVPTVVLIVEGQPVDAFAGAKSDKDVREFLAKNGLTGGGSSPIEEARELEAAGELAQAVGLLATWLEDHPDDAEVRTALANALISAEDLEGAREVFDGLSEEERDSPAARGVLARFNLIENAGDIDGLEADLEANPKDVGKRIELGRALVAAGRTEDGLEHLLEACMRDLHFEDDAPRKALIDVFDALGPTEPLTVEFQQRLSVLLCS